MLRVVVAVFAAGGCDDARRPGSLPSVRRPEALAPAACLLISRPVSSTFVAGALRRRVLRPTCSTYADDTLAWGDDAGVHVDVGGHVVDVVDGPTRLQARPCLKGVAVGRERALAQTGDGVVVVTGAGTAPFVLPLLEDDEQVVGVGARSVTAVRRLGSSAEGPAPPGRRIRAIIVGGGPPLISAHDGTIVGRVDGSTLLLDDGRRLEAGFVPHAAGAHGSVVVAAADQPAEANLPACGVVRAWIGTQLVLDGRDDEEAPLGAGPSWLYVWRKRSGQVVRIDAAGRSVFFEPRPAQTAAGVDFDGVREAVEFAMDTDDGDRLLVRERLRNPDCTLRDVLTLIDSGGAHVVADGEGARTGIGFFRSAPAYVESSLSYEPLASRDGSGTSEP